LILAGIENPSLKMKGNEFFEIDSKTFELGEDTPDKFDQVCEFSQRDEQDFDKIIKDPKQFGKLGQIRKDAITHPEESVRRVALGLFEAVISKDKSLEDAHTELTGFKKRQQWVPELTKLLDRQEKDEEVSGDLCVANYRSKGAQLECKEKLVALVERFQKMMS